MKGGQVGESIPQIPFYSSVGLVRPMRDCMIAACRAPQVMVPKALRPLVVAWRAKPLQPSHEWACVDEFTFLVA